MIHGIDPLHSCDVCGCDTVFRIMDRPKVDDFLLCARCQHPLGQEHTALDEMTSALWVLHDRTGNPRPEDIHSVAHMGHTPPETYEIREPSAMELNDMYERSIRLHDSFQVMDSMLAGQTPLQGDLPVPPEMMGYGPNHYWW